MHNYQELKVWQKAIELAKSIYEVTANFPGEEKFGLTSQVRRSSVSIASNIAEGAGRNSNKDFAHFLSIAAGSTFELETQMIIAKEISFLTQDKYEALQSEIESIKKMLYSLRNTLNQKS